MSDQMDDKIDAIAKMLGQDSVPGEMKDLIKSFASKMEESDSSVNTSDHDNSLEILGNAKNMIDKIQRVNDPRISLLLAIKPFLNSNRQKKISNCVNILRISLLADLFKKD